MALNDDQRLKFEMILVGSRDQPELLTDWETGFISSFEERYETYADNIFISAKQWVILDRIYDSLLEAGAVH